jgi:drug/metabolite transporter (DMT)-like permease
MMIGAAVCWSTGGLLVRELTITNAWEIVFWRSLFMAAFVAGVLFAMHGRERARRARAEVERSREAPVAERTRAADTLRLCLTEFLQGGRTVPRAVRAIGVPGLVTASLLAATFFFFIGSITRTTVANTFVLMSVSPFIAALAARAVLREPVPARTYVAMTIAFAGILAMVGGAVDGGQLTGNLLALGVAVCYAAQLTVLRKFHATVDMLPMVMVAGLFAIVPAAVLAGPFAATGRDLVVLIIMGCAQLGIGCLLATAASRTLPVTELGLLGLLEPILGPLWVWVLLGERPTPHALAGGALVLSAVIANQLLAAWRGRASESAEPLPGP